MLGPKAAVAGEKFVVQISAYDAFENPVTNYEAQGDGVVLRSSGTGVLAPAAVAAKEFKDGQARVTLTYTKAEALRVGVREQNREAGGESEAILITPGDPDQFRVTTPAEAVAGEGFTAQIEALDRFGNLIEDYDLRGLEVHLSTDGRGSSPRPQSRPLPSFAARPRSACCTTAPSPSRWLPPSPRKRWRS